MSLKLRILAKDGNIITATSQTEELLAVLLDVKQGLFSLDNDEEETLRGWLLVRADQLENGTTVTVAGDNSICIGKSVDGRAFVRDARGDWPPLKPDFGKNPF